MFIWEVGINNRISFLLYGIYVISFCWHFIIYVKLDRKYYFTQDGIWIDQITGEKISYDNLEIIKIWRTTAPFSGCSGNLKIRMNYNNKKYTAFLVPIEDEDGNEDTEIKMLLEWLPEPKYKGISDNRKQLYRRAGIICIIAGVSLVVFFGFKFAVLSGAFDNNGDDLQVAAVVKEEYKGYARYAVEDSKGNVYILIRNRGIVNKYNRSKVFLYAYKVPVGKRGYVSITIRNDYLYIKNRDDKVFIFNEEDFIETTSISELDKETGDQLTADNEMTEKLELFTKSLGYASGEVLMHFLETWNFSLQNTQVGNTTITLKCFRIGVVIFLPLIHYPHRGAAAQPVSTGIYHGEGSFEASDSSGGFNTYTVTNGLFHKLHIFSSSTACAEACRGFNKICIGFHYKLTCLYDFFFCQKTCLDNDLQEGVVPVA